MSRETENDRNQIPSAVEILDYGDKRMTMWDLEDRERTSLTRINVR